MYRRILLACVLSFLAAGLGCQHVGGKCDCQAHPADAVPLPITNPYPSAPVVAPVIPLKPGN